jgi:type VI secretion system protein ImpG
MKKTREYFERELGILQGYAQEYAAVYPAQATHLGMANGAGNDPHIQRLMQATAFSNARTAQMIDENDRKVPEAILGVNYRHYTLPFPSTALVQVDAGGTTRPANGAVTLPRGTTMIAAPDDGVACQFRTVQDVQITPVTLADVTFHRIFQGPPGMPQAGNVLSSISIGIECAGDAPWPDMPALRTLIAGEASQCAMLRDALFLHATAAWVELPGGRWHALDAVPLAPAGFAADEAMLPCPAAAHPAYRLLAEYFACPERFNFIDIVWPALAALLPPGCRQITLHLGLDIRHDSPAARCLAAVSRHNLLLHCTPVVNLFSHAACPFELDHKRADYALLPEGSPAAAYDIYSVDRVTALRATASKANPRQELTQFRPYYALRHGEARGRGAYYLVRRDPIRAVTHPGHDMRISLIDRAFDPLADLPHAGVSIDMTCTNRDLPTRLQHGAPEGDLHLAQGGDGLTVRLLGRPTPQYRFGDDTHWRLVSHLTLGHTALAQQGVDGLREVLALYDLRQSALTQRQIRAIAAFERQPARHWFLDEMARTPVNGVEIRLTLDEEAFVGTGLHLFAQVLDHFFGLCVHINSFTQLTILSLADGKELIRCKPRHGATELA